MRGNPCSMYFINDVYQEKSKSERVEELYNKLIEEREAEIQKGVAETLASQPESRFTQLERLQHTTNKVRLQFTTNKVRLQFTTNKVILQFTSNKVRPQLATSKARAQHIANMVRLYHD